MPLDQWLSKKARALGPIEEEDADDHEPEITVIDDMKERSWRWLSTCQVSKVCSRSIHSLGRYAGMMTTMGGYLS